MRRACRPSGPSPHPSRPRAMASELPTAPRMAKKHRIRKSPTVLRVRREASSCIAPGRGRLFFRRRAQGPTEALDFFRIRCFFAIRGASVRLQAAWEVVRRGVRSLGRDVFSGGHAQGVRSGRLLGREEHACRYSELADIRSPSWARASESKDLAQRARIRRRLRSPLPLGDAALVCRLVGLGRRDGGLAGISRYDGPHGTGADEEEHGKTHEDRLHAGTCRRR